nr:hypothetical protein [Bradyrhizobium diazoefficiens]
MDTDRGHASLCPPYGTGTLGGVVLFYVLAKLFELGDVTVFEATGHLVSGHTLKHLTTALAAWPVIRALRPTGFAPFPH